jgi:hypothetical protein
MNAATGRLTPVLQGDPTDVSAVGWRMLFYRAGARRGGRDYWGSESGNSAEEVIRATKRSQEFEVRWCAFVNKGQPPCESDTYFNSLGPVAVVEEASAKHTEEYPSASDTQKAVLSRLVIHWGEQLKEVRNKLVELERNHGNVSENPAEGVGSVTKEYTDLLTDAEEQYHSVRNLLSKLNGASIPSDFEVERYTRRFESDISRLNTIEVPTISNNRAQVNTTNQRSSLARERAQTGRSYPDNLDEQGAATEPVHPATVQLQRLVRHLLTRDSSGETQTPRAVESDTAGKSVVQQFFGDETFNRANGEFNRGQALTMAAARNRSCSTAREGENTLAKAEAEYGAVAGVNEGTATMQLTLVRLHLNIARRQVQLNCR